MFSLWGLAVGLWIVTTMTTVTTIVYAWPRRILVVAMYALLVTVLLYTG